MTITETQAILTTINGHINGKTGTIKDIHIMAEGEAIVEIDFIAFRSAFSGMNATRHGKRWRITIGTQILITYTAVDNADVSPSIVPAAD